MSTAPRVLLVRPDRNEADAAALTAAGWNVIVEPWLVVRANPNTRDAVKMLERISRAGNGTLLVITSPRTWPLWASAVGYATLEATVRAAVATGMKVAVVGATTAASLPEDLAPLVSTEPSAKGIVEVLEALPLAQRPKKLLLPGSSLARDEVARWGEENGLKIKKGVIYETSPLPDRPMSAKELSKGKFDAVVLRSPSAAKAISIHAEVPKTTRVVAVGPSTAKVAKELGGHLIEVPVVNADGLTAQMESLK